MGLNDATISLNLRLFTFESSEVGLVMEDSLFVGARALTPLVGIFKYLQLWLESLYKPSPTALGVLCTCVLTKHLTL